MQRRVRLWGGLGILAALPAFSLSAGCETLDCPNIYSPPFYSITVRDAATGAEICDAAIRTRSDDAESSALEKDGGTTICTFYLKGPDPVHTGAVSIDITVSRSGYETATVTVTNDFLKDKCSHFVEQPVLVELTPIR